MAKSSPTSIGLFNGQYFDYLDPDPSVIDLDVLEHGLDVPRFNNQTLRPITTLEHSLRVARIARVLARGQHPDPYGVRLWALMHDAHKALTPWGDCLRPGKQDWMRDVEEHVDCHVVAAINRIGRYPCGATWPTDDVLDLVKTADNIALYFEAMLWAPTASDWAPALMDRVWDDLRETYGLRFRSNTIDRFMPLIAPRPRECWRTEVEALLEATSHA